LQLEVVTVGEGGVSTDDALVHDETDRNLASLLVAMEPPDLPVALGVIYCDPATACPVSMSARIAPWSAHRSRC
jgi:2-oxoglutarate ferredoxin oxidoreductase subunit beta